MSAFQAQPATDIFCSLPQTEKQEFEAIDRRLAETLRSNLAACSKDERVKVEELISKLRGPDAQESFVSSKKRMSLVIQSASHFTSQETKQ